MRIVVTGAAGLTGGAVARRLAEDGHDVVGVVRRPDQRSGGGATAIADCADPSKLRSLLAGSDACVHVAGIQLGAALAAAGAGDHRLVVVSSAGIYSRHRVSAATYERNEQALRDQATNCVIVRPTMIYGSARDRNVHHVLGFARRYRFLPLIGPGDALVQPIHYLDLTEALVRLVGSDATGSIDAGGGAPLTIREAASSLMRALGLPQRLIRVPFQPALATARLIDAVRHSRWAERLDRLYEDRSVDNTRLATVTGLNPRDFPTGLRDMLTADE